MASGRSSRVARSVARPLSSRLTTAGATGAGGPSSATGVAAAVVRAAAAGSPFRDCADATERTAVLAMKAAAQIRAAVRKNIRDILPELEPFGERSDQENAWARRLSPARANRRDRLLRQ